MLRKLRRTIEIRKLRKIRSVLHDVRIGPGDVLANADVYGVSGGGYSMVNCTIHGPGSSESPSPGIRNCPGDMTVSPGSRTGGTTPSERGTM